MARPDYHVFICAQQRAPGHPRSSCVEKGAGKVLERFSQVLTVKNLFNRISLVTTGCLGPCQAGANVLVYPGGVLYMNVQAEDVDVIVEQHLLGGEPVVEKLAPAEIW